VDRTFLTTRSIEFDAVVVADGTGGIDDVRAVVLLQETYRHCKAIGAWGDGADLLTRAGIDAKDPGVLVSKKASSSSRKDLIKAMGRHREWSRVLKVV
jgi:catalase